MYPTNRRSHDLTGVHNATVICDSPTHLCGARRGWDRDSPRSGWRAAAAASRDRAAVPAGSRAALRSGCRCRAAVGGTRPRNGPPVGCSSKWTASPEACIWKRGPRLFWATTANYLGHVCLDGTGLVLGCLVLAPGRRLRRIRIKRDSSILKQWWNWFLINCHDDCTK